MVFVNTRKGPTPQRLEEIDESANSTLRRLVTYKTEIMAFKFPAEVSISR